MLATTPTNVLGLGFPQARSPSHKVLKSHGASWSHESEYLLYPGAMHDSIIRNARVMARLTSLLGQVAPRCTIAGWPPSSRQSDCGAFVFFRVYAPLIQVMRAVRLLPTSHIWQIRHADLRDSLQGIPKTAKVAHYTQARSVPVRWKHTAHDPAGQAGVLGVSDLRCACPAGLLKPPACATGSGK